MVVDWVSGNLYWASTLEGTDEGIIQVTTHDGRYKTTVYNGLPELYGLAVDPMNGYVAFLGATPLLWILSVCTLAKLGLLLHFNLFNSCSILDCPVYN